MSLYAARTKSCGRLVLMSVRVDGNERVPPW